MAALVIKDYFGIFIKLMRTYNEVIKELKVSGIHAYEGDFYEYKGL